MKDSPKEFENGETDRRMDGRANGQDDVILPIDIDDRPCIHCSPNHPFLHIHIISYHLMPDVLSSRLILSYFTTSSLNSYSNRLVHVGEFRASEGRSHIRFISVYLGTKLVKLINLTKKKREEWRIGEDDLESNRMT